MEQETLVALWRRVVALEREGDWCELLERIEPRLSRYVIAKLVGLQFSAKAELVEELVQEVYCRLFERGRKALTGCRAESDAALLSYLKTICQCLVVDHCRSVLSKKRGGGNSEYVFADEGSRARWCGSAEDRVLTRELRARLGTILAELSTPSQSERNRWIFERAVIEGWTSGEIGERTGLDPSGVDSIVHRMKQRLGALGLSVPNRATVRNCLQSRDL